MIEHQLEHLQIAFDEGIYLHGAQRILSGQGIYRDFFALTGPGTFWLLASWFKLFSISLSAAHALLSLEVGVIVACLYLIVNKFGNGLAGVAAASSYLALLMPFAHRFYINHRWDSTCCVAVSLTLLVLARDKCGLIVAAGVFAGLAAIFTPPTLLVALTITGVLFVSGGLRRQALWFLLGAIVPVVTAGACLALQGSIGPMLSTFSWVGTHYSHANRVPYGFVPPETDAASDGVSLLRRIAIYLPAGLPLLTVALFVWLAVRRQPIPFCAQMLLGAGLASAAACYPRVASNNLLFAAPLLVCFLIIVGALLIKTPIYRAVLFSLTAVSAIGIFWTITGRSPTVSVDSQMGIVNCSPRDARNIQFATAVINPGDTLFVYPYQPIWYSLTGAINSTRHDFLQPGMMTLNDETTTLEELTARPPEWMIWHNLPPRMVLAIWPNSDPSTLHFRRIEHFIRTRYSQVQPADRSFQYSIAIFHRIMNRED